MFDLMLPPVAKHSIVAVSYTHLDVYKRQIQQGAILESVFPGAQMMDLDNLKMELERRLKAGVTEFR